MMHIESASILTSTFSTAKGHGKMNASPDSAPIVASSSSSSSPSHHSRQSTMTRTTQSTTTTSQPTAYNSMDPNGATVAFSSLSFFQTTATTSTTTTTTTTTTTNNDIGSLNHVPEEEFRDLSSKLSSDTATVFPLLHSKSSVSTHWTDTEVPKSFSTSFTTIHSHHDNGDHDIDHDDNDGEPHDRQEEKQQYVLPRIVDLTGLARRSHEKEEEEESSSKQSVVQEDVWKFQGTKVREEVYHDRMDDSRLADNDDDDSSAALSLYLESKLALIWQQHNEIDQEDEPLELEDHHVVIEEISYQRRKASVPSEDVRDSPASGSTSSLVPGHPTSSCITGTSTERDDTQTSQPPLPIRPLHHLDQHLRHQHHPSTNLDDMPDGEEQELYEGDEKKVPEDASWSVSMLGPPPSPPKPTGFLLMRHRSAPGEAQCPYGGVWGSHSSEQGVRGASTADDANRTSRIPLPNTSTATIASTSLYNPVTGYSPGRVTRKKIWGTSNAHLLPPQRRTPNRPRPRLHLSYENNPEVEDYEEEDQSSITSEEVLERRSAQIRAELRYAELVELAAEAERAADAGQESFSGRPWLCAGNSCGGGDVGVEVGPPPLPLPSPLSQIGPWMRPSEIKRHVSYSEGFPMPTSSLHIPRPTGIRNLRDAEDVFPSFETLHKHLRTHYLRSRVSETTLIFEEEQERDQVIDTEKDGSAQPPIAENLAALALRDMSHSYFGTRDFMNSFSFDILRQKGELLENIEAGGLQAKTDIGVMAFVEDENDSSDDEASDVGDVLAEHLHTAERPIKPCHPMSLPGLPRIEAILPIPTGSRHRVIATLPELSRSIGRAPSVDEEGMAKPRILFPVDRVTSGLQLPEFTAQEEAITTRSPMTPMHKSDSPDFVTPARLREIRRPKEDQLNDFLSNQSMILPANSVIQESPFRQSPQSRYSPQHHRYGGPKSPIIPVTHLLLPAFSMGADGENEPIVQLSPSRSCDDDSFDDDDIVPNPLSPEDKERAGHILDGQPCRTTPLTPPGQATRELPRVSGPVRSLDLPAMEESDVTKRNLSAVKVTILGNSLDSRSAHSPMRRIVRPSAKLSGRGDDLQDSRVFSITPIVQTTPQPSFDGLDCRCLSPSLHDLLQDSDNQLVRGTGSHIRHRNSFRDAMNVFHKFSSKRERKIAMAGELFVDPRANDDFLQNYLYCTKEVQEAKERLKGDKGVCMNYEPCENDGLCGLGLALAGGTYCGFSNNEVDCVTGALGGGRSARHSSEILPLALESHKTEADNWFDAATERVDGILENLIRGATPKDTRFQPPSLRKIMRLEARSSRTSFSEASAASASGASAADEGQGVAVVSGARDSRPSVQALFQPMRDDYLSDTHFALVYGTSRSDYHATVGAATSSPLRSDVDQQQQQHSPNLVQQHLEIPTSYSSSSDEPDNEGDNYNYYDEEEVLSMTYISEPSM